MKGKLSILLSAFLLSACYLDTEITKVNYGEETQVMIEMYKEEFNFKDEEFLLSYNERRHHSFALSLTFYNGENIPDDRGNKQKIQRKIAEDIFYTLPFDLRNKVDKYHFAFGKKIRDTFFFSKTMQEGISYSVNQGQLYPMFPVID